MRLRPRQKTFVERSVAPDTPAIAVPENLSRAFRGLQPYGVNVDGNTISIPDQQDLERLAKPSPLIDDYATSGQVVTERLPGAANP